MVAPGLDAFRVARFKVALKAKDWLRLLEYKGSALFFSHTGPHGDGTRRPRRSA